MQINNIPGTPIPQVPNGVFRTKDRSAFAQARVDRRFKKIIEQNPDGTNKIVFPTEEGIGILTYHVSFPYPEKGIRDNFMMISVQIVKKNLMSWINFLTYKLLFPAHLVFFLLPWKFKIKIVEKFMQEFLNSAYIIDEFAYPFIMEKIYYTPFGQELIKGGEVFLREIGISEHLSKEFSIFFVSLVDHDGAYRLRAEDLFSVTTAEKMLAHLRKEIRFLMRTLAERDSREHLVKKFDNFAKLLTYTLWIPRVRKAFNSAIKAMKFEKLQLDEADSFHVKFMGDYKFFGMTIEERMKKWPEILKQQFTLMEYNP